MERQSHQNGAYLVQSEPEEEDGGGGLAAPPPAIEKDSRRAWLLVAGAFFVQLFIMGVTHVYGVFYLVFMEEFKSGKAKTAWVGSLACGLTMLFGPVASSLINRYGPRVVTIVGAVLASSSLLVSSFITDLNLLFLTFSVPFGLGNCFSFSPTMSMPNSYFERHLSIVTGIVVSGSSFGTLVLGPLTQELVTSIGWRNTFRILAGTALIAVWSGWLYPPPPPRPRPSIQLPRVPLCRRLVADLYLWKDRVFVIWVIALVLVFFGYYIPYVHLVAYAEDLGIPRSTGSTLLVFLGAATACGRLLFGKVIELRIMDRLHMHQLSMVVVGAGTMLLPLIKSYAGLVTYVIVIGLNDGCFIVLMPVLTSHLCGAENLVLAYGFLIGCASFTYSMGPAVAGWLYEASGSYSLPFHVSGVPILMGAIALFLIPWAQRTTRARTIIGAALTEPTYDTMDQEPPCYSDQEMFAIGSYSSESAQTIRAADMSHITIEMPNNMRRIRPRSRQISLCSASPRNLPEAVAQAIQVFKQQSDIVARPAIRPKEPVPRRRLVSECRPSEYKPGHDQSLSNARYFYSVPQSLQNMPIHDHRRVDDSRSTASATAHNGAPVALFDPGATRPVSLRFLPQEHLTHRSGSIPIRPSPMASPMSPVPPSFTGATDPLRIGSPIQSSSYQGQFGSPIETPLMPSILEEPKGYTSASQTTRGSSPVPAMTTPTVGRFGVAAESGSQTSQLSHVTLPMEIPPICSIIEEPTETAVRHRRNSSSQNAPGTNTSSSRTNMSVATSRDTSSDWTHIGSEEPDGIRIGNNIRSTSGVSSPASDTASSDGLALTWEELEAPPAADIAAPEPERTNSSTPIDGVFRMSDFSLTDKEGM